jgi:hypothetical protein
MNRHRAPWSPLLVGSSIVATVLCVTIGVGCFLAIPHFTGRLSLIFLAIPLLCLPFMVTGYSLRDGRLLIHRPGWNTWFPLDDFLSAEFLPHANAGSIRLCGNGGFFAFTGLFTNRALGRYRAFWTDQRRTVVLKFSKRTLVISPENPEAFVAEIQSLTTPPPIPSAP